MFRLRPTFFSLTFAYLRPPASTFILPFRSYLWSYYYYSKGTPLLEGVTMLNGQKYLQHLFRCILSLQPRYAEQRVEQYYKFIPASALFQDFALVTWRTPLSWLFYFSRWNNRSRWHTYRPTLFLSGGMLQNFLKLPSRTITFVLTRLLIFLLWPHFFFYVFVQSNYRSPMVIHLQRVLTRQSPVKTIFFTTPHRFTYFYKYKKQRSIKKWLKKRYYRQLKE